eukprot:163794_1
MDFCGVILQDSDVSESDLKPFCSRLQTILSHSSYEPQSLLKERPVATAHSTVGNYVCVVGRCPELFQDTDDSTFHENHPLTRAVSDGNNVKHIGSGSVLSHDGDLSSLFQKCSTIFKDEVICTTGLSTEEKKFVEKMVESMGGESQRDFTPRVTKLLGDVTGSAKHQAAQRLGTPFVLPSWVALSFDSGAKKSVGQFLVPVLNRRVICVTGANFRFKDRQRIELMVKSNGGIYSMDLGRHCTHLIAISAEREKYKFACLNGIPVVSHQWLEESIKNRHCANEDLFRIVVLTLSMVNKHISLASNKSSTFRKQSSLKSTKKVSKCRKSKIPTGKCSTSSNSSENEEE